MQRILTVAALVFGLLGCAQSPVERAKSALTIKAQADAFYAKRDCDNAIKYYHRLNEEMPKLTDGWFKIGNCHVYQNNITKAIEAYRNVILLEPTYTKAWHNLVQVQSRALAETIAEMYQKADMSDPLMIETRELSVELLRVFKRPLPRNESMDSRAEVIPEDFIETTTIHEESDENRSSSVESKE